MTLINTPGKTFAKPFKPIKAHAIVKLLESFDWNYVSVVHSDSEYGETGYESIRRAVQKSGKVCLTEPHVLHNQVRFNKILQTCKL